MDDDTQADLFEPPIPALGVERDLETQVQQYRMTCEAQQQTVDRLIALLRDEPGSAWDAAIFAAADRCEAICHQYMRNGNEQAAEAADGCKDAVRKMLRETESPAAVAAFLRRYNAWRREGGEKMPAPAEIGKAIDAAVSMLHELAEMAKQEPVAWYIDDDEGREYNGRPAMSDGRNGIPLYAHPVPAEPVNARLLINALMEESAEAGEFIGTHRVVSLEFAKQAIAEETRQSWPVRLTSDEINACLARWRSSRHETYENLAWIVEAASLRANGFQVEG